MNRIKKKEYTNMSQQLQLYTYCVLNKQYMGGVQKWEKAYLMRWEKNSHMTSPFADKVQNLFFS